MEDFHDDFDGEFMDDEPFEDDIEEVFDESEVENSLDDESEIDDDFTGKDAFILGGAMGWAYEEGLEEKERRKLEREMVADRKNRK